MESPKTHSIESVRERIKEGREKVAAIENRIISLRLHVQRRVVFSRLREYMHSGVNSRKVFLNKFPSLVAEMPMIFARFMRTRSRVVHAGVLRGEIFNKTEFPEWIRSCRMGMVNDALEKLSKQEDFSLAVKELKDAGLLDTSVYGLPKVLEEELTHHVNKRSERPITIESIYEIRELLVPLLELQARYFGEESGKAANDSKEPLKALEHLGHEIESAKIDECEELKSVLSSMKMRISKIDPAEVIVYNVAGFPLIYKPDKGYMSFPTQEWTKEEFGIAAPIMRRLWEAQTTPSSPPGSDPKIKGGPRKDTPRANYGKTKAAGNSS